MIEQLITVSTDKQEATVADILRCNPCSSFFQKLQNDLKKKNGTNQVPLIGFSSKCNLNMVKNHFLRGISYHEERECNQNVFAVKKENYFM